MKRSFLCVLTVILLAPAPAIAQDYYLAFYDVTDLVKRVTDFPAPRMGLATDDVDGYVTICFDFECEDGDDFDTTWGIDELVELIKSVVFPESWGTAGVEIRAHRGQIIIAQTAPKQMAVAKLLQKLERRYQIDSRLVAVSTEALEKLGFNSEGDETQTLNRHKVKRALRKLTKSGDVELLTARRQVRREEQEASIPVEPRVGATESGTAAERLKIRAQVRKPAKGRGLEFAWQGTHDVVLASKSDESETTTEVVSEELPENAIPDGTAQLRYDDVLAVRVPSEDGKTTQLLLVRCKRLVD